MKKTVRRLYESFQPNNYELLVDLDRKKMTFSGLVKITGRKVGRPSNRLVLHQKGLKISAPSIEKAGQNKTKLTVDRVVSHASFEEVRFHTKEQITPGEYIIRCQFSGKITDLMNGLYPCYFEEGGKKQKLLATQFESHHAREVFPCVDEPEAKATFDITVTADSGEVILSNTPAIKTVQKAGKQTTTFATSPKMSTYLVAIVYGNLGFKEAKTKNGTVVRTYATPDNVKLTDFALNCAVKCLEYFEDYFDIPYPLAKCDLVGLPDFANGAMENWGLITFREQCLFVDQKNTSLPTKQFVAMVVAHELAHQWFGNLVTMSWWTDLWLNEGFASWVEYLAVDNLFPDWEMWVQFIVNEQQSAMKLDALDNTHAVEVPVRHPDEIHSIFDDISYRKGASVIHMLHDYLGKTAFRDGLRHYLKENAYSNTSTSDLWQALETVSKQPVKKIMHDWTSQPGFPLVKASISSGDLEISQQRFYVHAPDKPSNTTWPIPLLSPALAESRLDGKKAVLKVDSGKFTKLNVGESGFYRTVYDASTLKRLAIKIESGELAEVDRLGVLSDSFEAAKAGMASITDCLDLLSAFRQEENSVVWDIIAANLAEVRRAMDDEEVRNLFRPFIAELTAKELKRLGWDEKPDDSYFDKLLRPTILGLAAAAEVPAITKEALRRFETMKVSEDVPADLRSVVYTTAARHGDEKTFDKLLELHNKTNSSEEKTTVCAALTSFKQEPLIMKALNLVKTDIVRKQDIMYWLAYTFGNFYGKHLAWQWVTKNWDWLSSSLGRDLSFFRTPIYAARSFSSPEFLKDFADFFEPRTTPALKRSIRQGTELLNWQIAWKQRDLAAIKQYLAQLR